ncbi:glutathione S-transferase family protein [Sphingomonas sp.]|uniref:glutathione S-transferase family protein n=1 Tax=Sphingomonas sp. TaxID=28214 RepID=UPI001E017714|nr:glutathione S-transferase family protein [Sphingomonas sp.]MBX9796673.1 glutathione S-transferase family protein [Sphingomonas sp.]
MKIIIGNRAYSSWSLRGWLAAKLSGLPFDEVVVPLFDADWDRRRTEPDLAASNGMVPILWDGDIPVWGSLAIIDYLADRTGQARFWPAEPAARALARSMAGEMHSGFLPLRRACPMHLRRTYPKRDPSPDVRADVDRIVELWAEARRRFGGGGPFLFGAFGAADIMYAPVCTRIVTHQLAVPEFAHDYVDAIYAHPWMAEWIAAAAEEPWVIDRYEPSEA